MKISCKNEKIHCLSEKNHFHAVIDIVVKIKKTINIEIHARIVRKFQEFGLNGIARKKLLINLRNQKLEVAFSDTSIGRD